MAILPSRVMAHFGDDPGGPRFERLQVKASRAVRPSAIEQAGLDLGMPSDRSSASPLARYFGRTDLAAPPPRATRRRQSAPCVQGPVLPRWQHGSSVTKAVAPACLWCGTCQGLRSRHAGRRIVDANPRQPFHRPRPACSQPSGSGSTRPSPCAANSISRAMCQASNSDSDCCMAHSRGDPRLSTLSRPGPTGRLLPG